MTDVSVLGLRIRVTVELYNINRGQAAMGEIFLMLCISDTSVYDRRVL